MNKHIDVDRLYVSAIDSKPITVESWSDVAGEDMEGFRYWQSFNYQFDDKEATLVADFSETRAVVQEGRVFTEWDEYDDAYWNDCGTCAGTGVEDTTGNDDECPACEGTGRVPEFEGALTEDEFEECLTVEPYQWGAEGPMMNYWYPIDLDSDEALVAAAKIDTCLCVVEVNGTMGLALTGGGMDLSWEICEAFISAGFLPPVHFADLPKMGNYSKPLVLAAMRRSLAVRLGWTQRALDRLNEQYPTTEEGTR